MNAAAPLDLPRRLWLRIEDFLLLNASGALDECGKAELVDGEIVTMNAQFRPHAHAQSQLLVRLSVALQGLDGGLEAIVEAAVALPPHDMPEPDIVVTSEARGIGPVPLASVALVVEVAQTTRVFDLGRKAAMYARHAIAEYWVVDLEQAEIVRHWQPEADGFSQRDAVPLGDDVASLTIAGLRIKTNGIA